MTYHNPFNPGDKVEYRVAKFSTALSGCGTSELKTEDEWIPATVIGGNRLGVSVKFENGQCRIVEPHFLRRSAQS